MNQRVSSDSVKEESGAGEEHGHAVLVGCVDRLLVAHRAAWLDHDGNTDLGRSIDAVPEWEEGV